MIYTLVARHLYFPLLDLHKRTHYRAALHQAEGHQRLPRARLAELQLAKLRRIVAHAAEHCRYYGRSFRAQGVAASDLRTAPDLRRFPLLGKAELFDHLEDLRSPVHPGKAYLASTSGSTGIAMRFYVDSSQHAWVDACQWRGRRWWHVDRGDPLLLLWSRPVDRRARVQLRSWLKYRLRNYQQFNTFEDFDDRRVALVVSAIRRHRPRIIYGYGSSIGRVASWMAERGEVLTGRDRPLVVEYSADHLHEAERLLATRVFAAPVLSAYGASEVGGVAQQCREGNLHVSVDHVVLEVLRRDGTPAEPDETGELVLTTLHNFAMPLVRYRVGDLGSYSLGDCPCGITLPLMRLQAGKAIDLVTTSAKQAVSAHVFDYINLHLVKHGIRGIRQFLVEQTGRDSFRLSVVQEQPFEPRAIDVFIDRMREHLGAQIEVATRFVDAIPLEATGKRRYFKKLHVEAP